MPESAATNTHTHAAPHDTRSLRGGFSVFSSGALSLASLRPMAVFAVVPTAILVAGLGSWMLFPIVLALTFAVALVFGEMASRFPLEGSVAVWSRQLIGPRTGWMTAWLYICAYGILASYVAYSASQKLLVLFGHPAPTSISIALLCAGILLVATLINAVTRGILAVFAIAVGCITVVTCLVVSTMLLVSHRHHGVGALFHSPAGGSHGWAWATGSLLAAAAAVGVLRGFEMPAEVAEEVRDPERSVPKAIVWSFVVAAALVLITSAALFISYPTSVSSVLDPAGPVQAELGSVAGHLVGYLTVLAYLAVVVIAQMAASRTLWISARDRELPASTFFGSLSTKHRLPVRAIVLVGVGAAVLPFISSADIKQDLYAAALSALMIAYLLPVWGALRARSAGRWTAGPWSLGRWGSPLLVVALAFTGVTTVNVVWPRSVLYGLGAAQWGPLATIVVLVAVGLLIGAWSFRDGGTHTRHFGHVELDLEPSRLLHPGVCIVCFTQLEADTEIWWDPEAHATSCLHCHELALHVRSNPGADDEALLTMAGHQPSTSTLHRVRDRGWHSDHGTHPRLHWKSNTDK